MGSRIKLVILSAMLSVAAGCAMEGGELGGELASTDDVMTEVSSEDLSGVYGTIAWTGGAGLTVRSGPGTSHGSVGVLAEGTRVRIDCQITGTSIGGNTVWNHLPDYGGYVTDYYMNTGYSSWITGVPRCDEGGGSGEPTTGPCGDLDYAGVCSGETLIWCEGGTRKSVDCSATGRTCGWQSASVGNNCLSGGTSGGGGGRLTISQILGGAWHQVSQGFGYSDFATAHADWYAYCQAYGNWSQPVHCAMDIGVARGTPVYAGEAGTVIVAGSDFFEDDWNNAGELRLRSADGTHVIYGHLSGFTVGYGRSVNRGDLIGYTGTAGTGAHLHLEIRVLDSSTSSGYRAVDPGTYFGY